MIGTDSAEATSCWSGSCSEDEGISVHEEVIENGYDDESARRGWKQ